MAAVRATCIAIRAVACVLALLSSAAGGESAKRVALAAAPPGPAVGDRIPSFEVADQNGAPQSFASVRGRSGAILYFHRSADWCIYCKMQLVELEASRAALARNGLGLAAISFDDQAALKAFADQQSLGFALLSDPGSRVIRSFGLLDASVAPNAPGYGVPVHGSLLVDEAGVVRARFFEPSQGHAAGVVLTRFFTSAYDTHEKLVLHDYVNILYSASTLAALAGERLELSLEVAPKDDILIMADDAGPARVALAWELEASSAWESGPVVAPQPTEALIAGERVRAHRDPARLTRSIVLTSDEKVLAAALDAGGDLVLNGALEYQACLAERCYSARTVPLRWRIQGDPASAKR